MFDEGTISAREAVEVIHRPLPTIYSWDRQFNIARYEERYGERRFDLPALILLSRQDRHGFRLYKAGLLSDDRISELKASIDDAPSAGTLVPLVAGSTKVSAALRARLIADSRALNRSPLDHLLDCYAASLATRGLVSEVRQ